MDDAAARAAAPKNGRPSEKRKKRKPKKKKQQAKDLQEEPLPKLDISSNGNETPKIASPQAQVPLSPRKQTLMRHKKSDATIGEPLFVSEVKELKRNRRPSPEDAAGNSKLTLDLTNQTVEDRATLFKCPAARIVVFHEQLEDSSATASSGTLLGHGEFEIFQLHNGDVTYLACGRLFVYPLLPKLKMLRIDKNQFVLPLVNPQRHWKIHIDSGDMRVIGELEAVLKKIVNYTNLWLPESGYASTNGHIGDTASHNAHSDSENETVDKNVPLSGRFTPIFNDIPELPISAPVSPGNLHLFEESFELLPAKQPVFTMAPNKSTQSITTSFATFNMAGQPRSNKSNGELRRDLHHPRAVILANPYRKDGNEIPDHHSDLSSMDSLLDEYEGNISTTKSINFNMSRPASRAISVTSSSHPQPVQYQRGKMALFPDRIINTGSHYGTVEQEEDDDDFPTTSLSRYNRAHHNGRSVQSRRSSQSELYTSVSNWMEPGPKNVLSHSKSNYSLASRHSNARVPNLNNTYREIYRTITLNQMSLTEPAKDKEYSQNDTSRSNDAAARRPGSPYYSKLLVSGQVNRKRGEHRNANSKLDGLSSNEVYKLLSNREQGLENRSAIGRFFGW